MNHNIVNKSCVKQFFKPYLHELIINIKIYKSIKCQHQKDFKKPQRINIFNLNAL